MTKLFTMYAGPATFGPKVQIQSVFGNGVWCKFDIHDQIPPGPIVFKYWSSDSRKWESAMEGKPLLGQSIWLCAKSTGTGGNVVIAVSGTGIKGLTLKILGTTGEMVGEDGNPVGDPFEIPDVDDDPDNHSDDEPSEPPEDEPSEPSDTSDDR